MIHRERNAARATAIEGDRHKKGHGASVGGYGRVYGDVDRARDPDVCVCYRSP